MNLSTRAQLPPHLRNKLPNPLRRPSQIPNNLQRQPLHRLQHIHLPIRPQHLVVPPLRPRGNRPVEDPLHHLLEPGLLKPALIILRVRPRPAGPGRALDQKIVPLADRAVGRRLVDVLQRKGAVLELEPAARLERVKGLLDDGGGVSEAGEEGPAVNVGELVAEGPFVFGVVDLELAVWWEAGGG